MCWSYHQMSRGSWQREPRRRDRTPPTDVRVSDAERDEVVEQLSQHTGEGRLTLEEFEQRVDAALHAKTRGDLDETLLGLPRPPARVRRQTDLGVRLWPVAVVVLLALAILTVSPVLLWIAVPVVWCRVAGGPHHRRRWHEIEAPRHDRDELTLV